MKVAGFLFDLDGVIIDSEHYYDILTTKVIKDLGHEYERDKIKMAAAGKSNAEVGQLVVNWYNLSISADELNALRKPLIDKVYTEQIAYTKGFETFYKELIVKYPLPTAIVTGCSKKNLAIANKRLDFEQYFGNHIYSTEAVKEHKPSPDGYLYAAQRLGVDCTNCLVFEDAPLGIVSGLRAGAYVVAITTSFTEEQLRGEVTRLMGKESERIMYINGFNEEALKTIKKIIS